ncbi:hypothetical protein NEOC84_001188|nr:hypothetical protein [Neochlamydia sp. AcF84]
MRKYFFLFCLLFNCLLAEESTPLSVEAESMHYNGELVHLSGKVFLEHELGKVNAQEIIIFPTKEAKKRSFSRLKIVQGAEIALQDGGQMSCSEAEIDAQNLVGKFLNGPNHEDVVYKENIQEKASLLTKPLEIKSHQLTIYLQRQEQEGKSFLAISEISASPNVTISYNHEIFAQADHGTYKRTKSPFVPDKRNTAQTNRVGVLSLQANKSSGICRLSNPKGDFINAQKIDWDVFRRQLEFDKPSGSLYTGTANEPAYGINFSCAAMTWDEQQDILTLYQQIEIDYLGLGKLTTPEKVYISRQPINASKQVSLIECRGPSVLNYQDKTKGLDYTLSTYHKLTVDRKLRQAHLESPRDANAHVMKGQQVHFTGAMGEIYADEAFIYYDEIAQQLKPVKLFLKGNIWLLKRKANDKEKQEQFSHLALSDRLEYNIETQEMLFLSDYGKRVLFLDGSNHLQISAPSVKVLKDPYTKKDRVQGIGDVRFNLIEKECKMLQERFPAFEEKIGIGILSHA